MMVDSHQLAAAAEQIRARGVLAVANTEGVLLTAAQCDAAATILREAEPSICNGVSAERPGFIEPRAQIGDGLNDLVFEVGILCGEMYAITPTGKATRLGA